MTQYQEPMAGSPRIGILALPEELILQILDFNVPKPGFNSANTTNLWKMCLVCRHFYTSARRLLYRDLNFMDLHNPCETQRKLHKTLESNPELGKFCRTLFLLFRGRNLLHKEEGSDHRAAWGSNSDTAVKNIRPSSAVDKRLVSLEVLNEQT